MPLFLDDFLRCSHTNLQQVENLLQIVALETKNKPYFVRYFELSLFTKYVSIMMNENLGSIMTKAVITVSPNDSLAVVKEIMDRYRVHHVPVTESLKLVGLISTYDLLKLNRPFDDYRNLLAADIMTTRLATLEPDDKVGSAAEVFLEHMFHAIPIINEAHELLGIVTTHDILKYEYRKEYPNEKK